jgi:uncharacterized glyoxalase superfamily protein PhnB
MRNLTVKKIVLFISSGDREGDFEKAMQFYKEIGFTLDSQSPGFAVFSKDECKFFLQKFQNEWLKGNLMMMLEVENLDDWWAMLSSLELEKKYEGVKLTAPQEYPWGVREAQLVDVCGIYWHIS